MNSNSPFVFLDTAACDKKNERSYYFTNPSDILTTTRYTEVLSLLQKIESYTTKWLAGFVSYEAAYGIEPRLRHKKDRIDSSVPLVWFGVFDAPALYDPHVHQWSKPVPAFISTMSHSSHCSPEADIALTPSYTQAHYKRVIRDIKRYIATGHTYQVNMTFDMHMRTSLDSWKLYHYLRMQQGTAYTAYIDTGDSEILSFSPELFFRRKGDIMQVQPMKGTAARGRWPAEDVAHKRALACDSKNRSENVMIVDLLRNDLGQICRPGTVTTQQLFTVETHKTVHQMTSQVRGRLQKGITYSDIFSALFPSGSVTGAPKIRTMELIRQFERGRRGVYCGALGFMAPQKQAVFSIPIRTVWKKKESPLWTYRVGSGIVWDSCAEKEWDECMTKCRFISEPHPQFSLVETMRWDGTLRYKRAHLQRMKRSIRYFHMPVLSGTLERAVKKIEVSLRKKKACMVRLFYAPTGCITWETRSLEEPSVQSKPRVMLGGPAVDDRTIFLYHKTTYRPWYEKVYKDMRRQGLFDMIFCNQRGEITEGTRTTIFIERKGMLYTPPVSSGILPGILRAHLIQIGRCVEQVLFPNDIYQAERVYCGNSVRGLIEVTIQ